jgi:glycosyltransferase involved in cell wall biosynthesis
MRWLINKMINMKLTIAMSNRNRAWLLERSIYLISKQTLPQSDWELIIVDDGSTDDSEKIIYKYKDMGIIENFHYIKNKKQRHDSQGNCALTNNIGPKAGIGEYILLTDPEVMPLPDWAEQHYLAHEGRTDTYTYGYCLHPREYHVINDNIKGAFLGNAYTDYDWYNIEEMWKVMNNKIKEVQKHYNLTDRQIRDEFFAGVATQAGFSISRKLFCQIRGFEEDLCNKSLGLDKYGGDDQLFRHYLIKNGCKQLNLCNARAVHIYHGKDCQGNVGSEYSFKYMREHRGQLQSNLGREWGLIEKNGFVKMF